MKSKIEPLTLELISPALENHVSKALAKLGLSLQQSEKLAESIVRLSDFYIQNPERETPWSERWAQVAYLVYFHPLNLARNILAIQRGHAVGFFDGLEHVLDFGAGLGSASQALQAKTNLSRFNLIEPSQVCWNLIENQWRYVQDYQKNEVSHDPGKTLSVFSYALTELASLPDWILENEALMILEPATSEDGRRLLQVRQALIASGFYIWAPCTHQRDCPLLSQSKTDWCHDRAHMTAPEWFVNIEKHLPFRNNTITTSYLLARKKRPKEILSQVRLVGDHLNEKGKSRQMICRGPEREFLSWLHRHGPPPIYPRGELIDMPSVTVRGRELRVDNSN